MGVKQRDLVRMSEAEVSEFLDGRHTMSVATIGPDGHVHLVAMWYGFLEGAPAFETKAKSQKVLNLRRDSRLTALVEDGNSYEVLRGVELVGTGEIIEDFDRMWPLGVSVFERYQGGVYTEEMRPFVETMLSKRVVVKLHVERVVSWDHRKLGM
ncbi:MAG: PPOX class F420-dependent oxidoreductase [Acidimicrobiales bacterium]